MVTLDTITEEDIAKAAKIDDVDEALRSMMDKAGITDGGIAGIVFSDFPWEEVAYGSRVGKIREWIETERIYAEPEEVDDEPDDRCTNPGGHSWVEGPPDRGDEGPIRCEFCGADGDA